MRQSKFFEWKTVSDAQVQAMFNPKFAVSVSRSNIPVKRLERPKFIRFVNESNGKSAVVKMCYIFAEPRRHRPVKIKLFRYRNS